MADAERSRRDNPRDIPLPVLHARAALDLLRAEDAVLATSIEKILPGYALNLAKTGQEITVENLLVAARGGAEGLKITAPENQQSRKSEDHLAAYERIIGAFDPYEGRQVEHQLMKACERGDLEKVKSLIEQGADITVDNNYALQWAAEKGHNDIIKLLIERGVDITTDNNNAVKWAAGSGHTDTVKLLIEHNADYTINESIALGWAAQKGQTNTVKLLIEQGADITAQNQYAVRWAARNGHIDTLRLLIEYGADITIGDNTPVQWAAENGHLDIVRLLTDHGADITATNNSAVRGASQQGHVDIVKLLIEHGADITADDNRALKWAAENGHTEIIKLLIQHDADVAAENNTAVINAAVRGHSDTVRLLIEHGAEITAQNNMAIIYAARNGHFDTVQWLLDHGADRNAIGYEQQRSLTAYEAGLPLWQKTVRMGPPQGLHCENPAYFKKTCFEAIVKMLGKEGYTAADANIMAFHAAGLFQSEQRVLQYLTQWGSAGKQPLHDLIQMIKLPKTGTPNLKDWGDAVLKCGPSMARLVKFADKIPSPMHSSDGKTWSMINTRVECAKHSFKNAAENPTLAALCFEHEVDSDGFNEALKIVSQGPPLEKTIPDIVIDGAKFDMEGAQFHRLPISDLRGLFLGEITDCCQSIGSDGGACAEHGYTSKDGAFFAVENAKGKIIAQSWAWRGTKGELCLDSLETLGQNVSTDQWKKILQETAKELTARKDHDITALHVGTGGATPANELWQTFTQSATATPRDYSGYRDSKSGQILVWKR